MSLKRLAKIAVAVLSAGVVFVVLLEAYFYVRVLRPGVNAMIEAAQKGDVESQMTLGALYVRPAKFFPAIRRDVPKAVHWLRKAADQGNSQAEMMLAMLYGDGDGVQRDNAEAVRWMRQAAQHGNADGQWLFARMFDYGYYGMPRAEPEAIRWYTAAAQQGHARAHKRLAELTQTNRVDPR